MVLPLLVHIEHLIRTLTAWDIRVIEIKQRVNRHQFPIVNIANKHLIFHEHVVSSIKNHQVKSN